MTQQNKWKRWLKRSGWLALILVIGYVVMSFIYRMPDISSRTQSYMIDDGHATSMGRKFGGEITDHPGQAGVFVLNRGRDAFAARAMLARMSEKSLDIQYYMYHQDTVGGLLTYEVLKAADRGVRVRMLIDDMYGNQDEDTWVALNGHENIQVRLWNPWKRAGSRAIQSVVRGAIIDYRMHAKSSTADNEATVLGGRNIGDEYFDADRDLAFADIDVLSIGPPVREVSGEFDSYWNAEHAYPVDILIRQGTEQELTGLRAKKQAFFEKNSTSDYIQAVTESDLAKGLKDGSLAFSWSKGRVIHDSPQKMDLKKAGRDERLIAQLAPFLTGAKRTVDIVSPYFVPGDKGAEALCKLSQDGVKVRVLTNSLASNDVTAVHAGYSKYRRKLLRCGVRLFELDESLKDREGKAFTWLPGLAKSSLHAKSMVFDGEVMFVGSFNFDERSLNINNEIGLVFHDPAIAGNAAQNFEDHVNKIAFEVSFSGEDGRENMHWTGGQGGPDVVMEKEPYATTMQKLTVGILKWLPIDSQL